MMKLLKSPAPQPLIDNYKKWGKRYKAKRLHPEKSNDFIWATYRGQKVNTLILPSLKTETNYHCAFCDGFPIEATGETIEHFRPKSSFPLISYLWSNLFYCCNHCNENKGEDPERDLINPNKIGYSFENYFLFDYESGKIECNPELIGIERNKVENTIKLYGLNEFNRPKWRKKFLSLFLKTINPDIEDFPYRFIY